MKRIGVIGGLGPQSTQLFYQEFIKLCQSRTEVDYPNMIINNVNIWEFFSQLKSKKLTTQFIKREIEKIHDHVDFIALPCNTVHFIIDEIRAISKVPVIGIHEEVVKVIKQSAVPKVGILATKSTVLNQFYQSELIQNQIEFEVLEDSECEKLNALIWEKMLRGQNYDDMRNLLLYDIDLLIKKGCQGVILACTELPLFVAQQDVDVTLFASTNILAKSVYDRAFA